MRKSENFDLNLYEGTDIFNPLTNDVPNYEKIDAQMKKNYNLSVGKATELKTGTVHALTRENADCPMIHFTATSNFTSNDTFTVDGVQVSALLVDGSTLPTNCYIIGSEVICYLKGTLLTFFLSGSISKDSEKLGGELPVYYSKQEDFTQLQTTVTSMNGVVEKNTNDITEINESLSSSNPAIVQNMFRHYHDTKHETSINILGAGFKQVDIPLRISGNFYIISILPYVNGDIYCFCNNAWIENEYLHLIVVNVGNNTQNLTVGATIRYYQW